MPTNRCRFNNVWDSTTRRYRVCKNQKCNGNYCIVHYKLLYFKPTIIIQKMYKGYYIRKKLKIYYNLPRDLQRKIIWHINSDLYLRNYNSSVSKIIYRRYQEFYNKYISISQNNTLNMYINYYISAEVEGVSEVYTDLISLVKLSIKYYLIMNIYKIPHLNTIKSLCRRIQNLQNLHNTNHTNLSVITKYNNLFN